MKKCLIIFLSVALLLSLFSCVTESEADASGKIKRADLALKNLRQSMDKFYQVRGYYPYISANLVPENASVELIVDDTGIFINSRENSVALSYITDTTLFNESDDSILLKKDEFLVRRWVYYLRSSDRHLIIDTLNASLNFGENESLGAVLRVKDTNFIIAVRDGTSEMPYHIYEVTPSNLLAVKDSGLISFVKGEYTLSFESYSYAQNNETNSLWLFDTLALIEDSTTLREIKEAIALEDFIYETSDPFRKYFIAAHATDRNNTPVTTRKVAKASYDYSMENIQAIDPVEYSSE
ncbi:hypothetical protein JXA84_07740 [candidate division WOR-3 bacterium]|nr:hypothetical protein [candidate division WOR-3 bacterium]